MILPGLCSITFRKQAADEIITLAARHGLDAIEWDGDIHVPAGDVKTATAVGLCSVDAGLRTPASCRY